MRTLLVIEFLLIAGCSTARQGVIDISTENVKNAETMREVSLDCLSVWPIQSGFIKGALGSRINELPNEAIEAIEELDRLAELPNQSDYELGYFLGLKMLLWGSTIQIALEKYAPSIVEYLF